MPGYEAVAWFMVAAPAKTPAPIVQRLHTELKAVLAMPEVKAQLTKLSLVPMDTPSVAEMQSFVKSEIARWGKVVEAAGIARVAVSAGHGRAPPIATVGAASCYLTGGPRS